MARAHDARDPRIQVDVNLPGGTHFDGLVTFNCGGPATIDISTGTGTKTISADTTIDGGGLITISGGNAVGLFEVDPSVTFTVRNLTIADGSAAASGGGILNNTGTVNITNSTLDHNSAGLAGGGIYDEGVGTLTLTNTIIANSCRPHGPGGAADGGGRVRDAPPHETVAGRPSRQPLRSAISTQVLNHGPNSAGSRRAARITVRPRGAAAARDRRTLA